MHELGTVFYVIREVEQVVEENHLTKVASVTLEIGEVSGIIPYYLTDCWQWAIQKSQYLKEAERAAKITIKDIKEKCAK